MFERSVNTCKSRFPGGGFVIHKGSVLRNSATHFPPARRTRIVTANEPQVSAAVSGGGEGLILYRKTSGFYENFFIKDTMVVDVWRREYIAGWKTVRVSKNAAIGAIFEDFSYIH